MSILKTKVNSKVCLNFLTKNFDPNISSLSPIKGGEMSQAFSFGVNNHKYVIRVNKNKKSFEKDKYACEHFASDKIPIPQIVKTGQINKDYYFAISKKANGKDLDNFGEKVIKILMPQLISILDAIHQVDIRDKENYGYWDSQGRAKFKSWKKFILARKDSDYHNWEEIFGKTFFKKEVFDRLYKEIVKLVKYIPEERQLVHGDYGFNNVISDGVEITGVADWGESMYGDFLYDVAWLGFWSSTIKYGEIFEKHYRTKGLKIPHFTERLLCYKFYLGLGSLSFFAKSNQEKSYIWTKDRLFSLL